MLGEKREMDYQFDPDKIDKQTAFENLKFIHEDESGLGNMNAGYCHAFANFIFFMSNPTFIRTIKQFKQNVQLYSELMVIAQDQQCMQALSNNKNITELNNYQALNQLLTNSYGAQWMTLQGKELAGLLKMIYLICQYTDKNGKIIEDKGRSDKYAQGYFVDVNAKHLYEEIIQHVNEAGNRDHADSKIYYSFFQQCAYIMSGRKVSALSLIRNYTLNTNEDIFACYDKQGMEKILSDALRNDGDRIFVTAGGNHFFVVYKKDKNYHAIGAGVKKIFATIKEAIYACMVGKNTNALTIDLQNPEKDLIKTGVWEAIYDIRTLLLDLQVASNKGVPYINACASENIKCFVKRYFDPYNPDYLRITSKVCKQFQEYMLENIDYIAMGYTIPIPLINMDGCCVVDSNGNLQYKIAANNLAGAKNVIIRNQMVMNPQIMPPNNIVNNNMNNNMLPNNVNNHMGMNNSNLIPQGIQNNSLMNQRIDEGLNLVNQKNNVGERNPDHHSVKNRIYTFNQGGVGFSRQPVTSNMNNNPEYLFGLKCLGKKPQEISECCAKLYWPSCC